MLNLQTMDSCIMLFNPQLCTKSIFLLGNMKKNLHRKNSTQYQMHTPHHQVQSEIKRRALSFHRPACWYLLPHMTLHIQTTNPDSLFQRKICSSWALWFEPYLSTSYHGQGKLVPEVKFIKCKLHGSLQALRKKLWKEYQTLFIFLLTLLSRLLLWSANNLLWPWRPSWFFIFF